MQKSYLPEKSGIIAYRDEHELIDSRVWYSFHEQNVILCGRGARDRRRTTTSLTYAQHKSHNPYRDRLFTMLGAPRESVSKNVDFSVLVTYTPLKRVTRCVHLDLYSRLSNVLTCIVLKFLSEWIPEIPSPAVQGMSDRSTFLPKDYLNVESLKWCLWYLCTGPAAKFQQEETLHFLLDFSRHPIHIVTQSYSIFFLYPPE